MRITAIATYALELPLAKPCVTFHGRVFELLNSTMVKLETDEGLVGWGEVCSRGSNYLPALAGGVRAAR